MPVLDGEAFGAEMVQIVREFVASELDPILAANKALALENAALIERVVALETRALPVAEKGEPGERGIDGADCDMGEVERLIGERVAAVVSALPPAEKGEPGRDGQDADMSVIEAAIASKVAEVVSAIPPAKDGRDIDRISIEQNGADVTFVFECGDTEFRAEMELPQGPAGADGKDGEQGPAGSSGKLELARAWTDEVHYEGAVRTHNGGAWQALRDTAKEPPHADWICLASRGADGRDGVGFNLRGLWLADSEYKQLDVVALNGASFAAKTDDPGVCPGEGWQLFAQQGKRGAPGERGHQGERGLPAPTVAAMAVNDEGLLSLQNADGSVVTCDFYPVLSQIKGR